jgi:hypothetical protein
MSQAPAMQLSMAFAMPDSRADGHLNANALPESVDRFQGDEPQSSAPRSSKIASAAEHYGASTGPAFEDMAEVFRRIKIADEAIKAFAKRSPFHESALDRSFLALRWQLPGTVPDRVYRAHVEELLQRVIAGESLVEGTRAEVMFALSGTTLIAALGQQAAALYKQLFSEIWGADSSFTQPVSREPWPGALNELLHELRRRVRLPERKLKPEGDKR